MSQKKSTSAAKIRVFFLLTLFLVIIPLGIDYFLAQRWEEILADKPQTFEVVVEADMCNALTDIQYIGSRIFLHQMIKKNIQEFKLTQGSCGRGTKSSILITKILK